MTLLGSRLSISLAYVRPLHPNAQLQQPKLISTSLCGLPALLDVRLTVPRVFCLLLSYLIYCGGM